MGTGRIWWPYTTRERYKKSATNDAWSLTHRSVAKSNSNESPYLLANEWIGSQIANFLRLPSPPAALARNGTGQKGMFASLEFGGVDEEPDDVDPTACMQNHPNLCVGVLLFDILIANADRHRGNIRVDDPQSPTKIAIIDCDRALFGIWEKEGVARLTKLRNRLGITGGDVTGENRHCFLDLVKEWTYFQDWIDRIQSIPEWFVTDICNEVVGVPITRQEADAAIDFLVFRCKRLPELIWEYRHEFAITQPGLFNPFINNAS